MRWIDKGAPRWIRNEDGSYRLEIPGQWECESEEEEARVDEALQKAIKEALSTLE